MKIAKITDSGTTVPFQTTINAIPGLKERLIEIEGLIQRLKNPDFSLGDYSEYLEVMNFNDSDTYGYVTVQSVLDLEDILDLIEQAVYDESN